MSLFAQKPYAIGIEAVAKFCHFLGHRTFARG